MSDAVWETQDGRKIPVSKMADSHVVNAIRCFRAKAVAHALSPEPEEDTDQRRRMAKRILRLHAQGIAARLAVVEAEAKRRGLDV